MPRLDKYVKLLRLNNVIIKPYEIKNSLIPDHEMT